jgi:hypothetical protein
MASLKTTLETGKRLARLVEICESLPDVSVETLGRAEEHRSFRVRRKIFAYYLFDHHGDGRIALCCKAPIGEQGRLVSEEPRRFFVPPYVGPKGWIGVRLDVARVNWTEIAYHLRAAYRLSAPRALALRVE